MTISTLVRQAFRIPGSSLSELPRNLLSGVVVGVIALPLSIALAVAVGVPPIAGLYTAAFAGATASIFGGSRYNITGPTAALVPILSHAVLQHGAAALPMIALVAGLMLIAMSFLKFGQLVRFMPGPVIVGFTAGIALSIAFGQLNNFLAVTGTDPSIERFAERVLDTVRHLNSVGVTTPLVGLAAVVTMLAWPRFVPRAHARRDHRTPTQTRSARHPHGDSAATRSGPRTVRDLPAGRPHEHFR